MNPEIFDVGAGAGLVGRELMNKHNFQPIVGCDAASKFVDHINASEPAYKEASVIWMGRGLD